jgi:translation initiation factor 2 alpha subunit (eIF-2alpha)
MEVTLKNIEIVNPMQSIGELLLLEDLSTKVNWNLTKHFKKLQSSFKTYSECEQELLKKHALKVQWLS